MLAVKYMESFKCIFNTADVIANFCYWLQVRAGGVAASLPSYIKKKWWLVALLIASLF